MRVMLLVLTLLLGASATAHAQDAVGYALVVGSNAPGPGQQALVYAEEDAREVATLLRELGGFDPRRVRLVQAPSAAALLAAIDEVAAQIAREASAGQKVRLWFYYSGHAKASGLVLGGEELALELLRSRLLAIKASLTLVVLDACQSGAFSRVKGAAPAADFSYNSRARLESSGVVVLASSTGSELSQESDYLRSSFFTHHLLVALRGAADDNRDGRVSLDEAYRYTYHQTLVSTSGTAVGGQHVSVEVDLKGAGELPLSFPERATAQVTLPAEAEGHALLVRLPSRAVTAELHKARGAAAALTVAPGSYQLLLRTARAVLRCPFSVASGAVALSLQQCSREALAPSAVKSGRALAPLRFSVLTGLGAGRGDAYTQRLEDFGYEGGHAAAPHFVLGGMQRLHDHVSVGGQLAMLGGGQWSRFTEASPLELSWDTYAASAQARLETGRRLVLFAQFGAGLALTRERFRDELDEEQRQDHLGLYADAALGIDVMFSRRWGMSAQTSLSYAPSLPNLLGDRHDTGLWTFDVGMVVLP